MLFNHWVDFVVFPYDPDRVLTYEERMDTSRAVPPGFDDSELTYSNIKKHGAIIVESAILIDDDVFEAMEIGESGSVVIWTKKYVWVLRRDHGNHHRLMLAPRNPPNNS